MFLSAQPGRVFKLSERGCVEDQPQHALVFDGFPILRALRPVLRTQPRSACNSNTQPWLI